MWLEIVIFLTALTMFPLLYILKCHHKLPKITRIFKPFSFPYFDSEVIFSVPRYELPMLFHSFYDLKPVIYANVMALPNVFITDLDDLACILRAETERPARREVLLPWLDQILLTDGCTKFPDKIREVPNDELLWEYSEIANRQAITLTQIINLEQNSEYVRIIPKIYLCVLDIMCEAGIGVDTKVQTGNHSEYARTVFSLSHLIHKKQMLSWLLRSCVFNLTPAGRNQNKLLKKAFSFSGKMIMSRMMEKELHKNIYDLTKLNSRKSFVKLEENGEKSLSEQRNISYLDILMKNNPSLSVKEAQEEINTFIFSSHDKTSAAIVWTLFELGHNPQVQELAYLEQRDIFQSSQRPANSDDLCQMTYLDRIIKETFRLYPSTAIVSRRLKSDVTIRGYEIPAGTDIPIFVYHIHRNSELYPNPEQFNPDRFLPNKVLDLRRESYTPLIFGPRYCFAEEFTIMVQKIILSHILRHFTFQSLDKHKDLQLLGDFILRPKIDLKFSFKPRLRHST